MSDEVTICECFCRDGLQHEEGFVPTAAKLQTLAAFTGAGFRRIEATSYSNPTRIPAFRDASEVLAGLKRRPGVRFKATCANRRALERALVDLDRGHGADEVSLLASATDAHSFRNLGVDRADQWQRLTDMAKLAADRFVMVGVISVAFGCPFEGRVDPGRVVEDYGRFADLGARLVTLGDTTGLADPRSVGTLVSRIRDEYPAIPPVGHFHDSRGAALANAVAALNAGCRHLDSSMGGVGGHPAQIQYGCGMTGNLATEDLAYTLDAMGIDTGLDLDQVMRASALCEQVLGRRLEGRTPRAGWKRMAPPDRTSACVAPDVPGSSGRTAPAARP